MDPRRVTMVTLPRHSADTVQERMFTAVGQFTPRELYPLLFTQSTARFCETDTSNIPQTATLFCETDTSNCHLLAGNQKYQEGSYLSQANLQLWLILRVCFYTLSLCCIARKDLEASWPDVQELSPAFTLWYCSYHLLSSLKVNLLFKRIENSLSWRIFRGQDVFSYQYTLTFAIYGRRNRSAILVWCCMWGVFTRPG